MKKKYRKLGALKEHNMRALLIDGVFILQFVNNEHMRRVGRWLAGSKKDCCHFSTAPAGMPDHIYYPALKKAQGIR